MRFLAVVFVVLSALAVWLFLDGSRAMRAPLDLSSTSTLHVPAGSNLRTVARQLESDGVIPRADYLYGYARLKQQAHLIKAGEYALADAADSFALLDLLVGGKAIQHKVTLVEGWNMRQVREALAAEERLKDDVSETTDQELLELLSLADDYALPEGLFMPDTYQFTSGDKASSILNRAQVAMDSYLDATWDKRADGLPIKSAYEALTLASIVEKETGLASERPTIAGVFTRRLHKGMRLQTDPTVIYGIGPTFDGNIRRKHLVTDNPYNTYTRAGLTPTPIALAGRAAIDAVLHPEDGETLFFVSKGDGSHKFSVTLDEHEAAVRKYQLKR